MGPSTKRLRVVHDTNVVLSALLFAQGRLSWMRNAWAAGEIVPLVHRSTVQELIRVLSYPKFSLEASEISTLLGEYLPYAEVVDEIASKWQGELPLCRDPEDQIFLQVAAQASADTLVTGDQHLLELAGEAPFDILTPEELRWNLRE